VLLEHIRTKGIHSVLDVKIDVLRLILLVCWEENEVIKTTIGYINHRCQFNSYHVPVVEKLGIET